MKILSFFILSLVFVKYHTAQAADTLHVGAHDLNMRALQKGEYNYIVYFRKTKESPSRSAILVRMNVNIQEYKNKPAIVVTQQWERDTIIHTARSIFNTNDFSTISHDTWWKALGYSMKFDFDTRKVEYKNAGLKNGIPDSVIKKGIADFEQSFEKYNLNWHDDLIIYTLLPYREGTTFIINFYDPGFGKAEEVAYAVTGSEILISHDGQKRACWVLNHNDRDEPGGYERFWIDKKTHEVLKEEDFGRNGYRYKLKIGISGN